MTPLRQKGRNIQFVDDTNPVLAREDGEQCDATFWVQQTPGTTYWRCLVPARHLPGQALTFSLADLAEDKEGKPYVPRQKGAAVWQFLGDMNRTRVALGQRDLYGIRTLMEVDDNYLRPAPYMHGRRGNPWSKTIMESAQPGKSGYSNEMHRRIAPEVDGIICATDYLADAYSDFNDNVYVCPNSIDPDDWQYEREEHDAFRIVYYGSSSHIQDAPLVTKALKWASRQPGVEVWTVGFKNPGWSFPKQHIEWSAHLDVARSHLFKFDVGIAPLKANQWANGKSDIKAMEYAMAGVLPILQDAEPFSPWADMGWKYMARTEDDWVELIRYAVEHQDVAKTDAEVAREYVLDNRTIHSTIHKWREALDG